MTPEEIKQAIETLENLWKTSRFSEAMTVANELLEQQELFEDVESLVKVYNILGVISLSLSDYSNALEYYYKALTINEEIGNKNYISANLGNIGNVYNGLSEYPKALEYYYKSLQIVEENGNKSGIAANFGNIGNVFQNLSDFPKALEFHEKALLINEEMGNKNYIATNLRNIGIVYNDLSDYPKSLEYLEKALNIDEEIGNKVGISANLGNMGLTYENLKDYLKALEYHLKSLHIDEEIGNKAGIAATLGNIGSVYWNLSNYPKSLEYSEKALQINEEIGSKVGVSINLLNIGVVFSKKESSYYNGKKAEEYLHSSLKLAEEIGAKDILKELYEQLYMLRLNEERYKEALECKLNSISLEKEIQSIEAKKQAERFDIDRKSAEREKQIVIERTRYEEREIILRNILPDSVTDRLVKGENPIADHFDSASVLFMDLVGFTTLASIAPPKQLVYLLDAIFQKADDLIENYGLEKIKTIGDGYLAVANVTTPLEDHQKATAQAALHLLETMKDFVVKIPTDLGDTEWIKDMNDLEIRIGIHTGEVVAGIIGENKYTYDLWGDAVNVASRMESNSEAGRIHISDSFAKSIEQHPEFNLIPRGEITIKGKGLMKTYWLEKAK